MNLKNDTFELVQRKRAMVYSNNDFGGLRFLYQDDGLPNKDLDF